MTGAAPGFRLGYVPGVTISRWQRTWAEREPGVPLALVQTTPDDAPALVRDRGVHAALLRLPVDKAELHAIPLYTETTVVLAAKEHWLAAADEVTLADLAEEVVLHPVDDVLSWSAAEPLPGRPAADRPGSTTHAIGMVAAEAGVLLLPLSLARLHQRKDLIHRPVTDAPQSRVALSWPADEDTSELVEVFIGIVRGRTANSTRGRTTPDPQRPQPKPAPAKSPAKSPRSGKPAKPGKPARPAKGRKRR